MTLEEIIEVTKKTFNGIPEEDKKNFISILTITYESGFSAGMKRGTEIMKDAMTMVIIGERMTEIEGKL